MPCSWLKRKAKAAGHHTFPQWLVRERMGVTNHFESFPIDAARLAGVLMDSGFKHVAGK